MDAITARVMSIRRGDFREKDRDEERFLKVTARGVIKGTPHTLQDREGGMTLRVIRNHY